MHEDEVVGRAIDWFTGQGWKLIYQTRPIADGAIGGVDAILMKVEPWKFVFIDGKGAAETKERRSGGFTNCLGALIKRIRFEQGYLSNEAVNRFIPDDQFAAEDYRQRLTQFGVHKNSEYVLALTPDMRETVRTGLDPALAALLHVHVLLVSESAIEEMQW
jgi:hypothetical protein